MSNPKRVVWLLGAVAILATAGCQSLDGVCLLNCGRSQASSTTLVEFLYPDADVPPPGDPPALRMPMRVGLSFLPSKNAVAPASAAQREDALRKIKGRFADLDYVSEIVVVPDYYLSQGRTGGGFDALQRVARLHNLDLIALASYVQVSQRDENRRALSYLTIVGAFLVRGSRNETGTLLDLAVIEPQTRSLLLRAGGTSLLHGSTTAIDQAVNLRNQQAAGFEQALVSLNDNFARELTAFEERVRNGTAPLKVERRSRDGGRSGGGGRLDELLLLMLASVLLVARSGFARRAQRELRRLTVRHRSAERRR